MRDNEESGGFEAFMRIGPKTVLQLRTFGGWMTFEEAKKDFGEFESLPFKDGVIYNYRFGFFFRRGRDYKIARMRVVSVIKDDDEKNEGEK